MHTRTKAVTLVACLLAISACGPDRGTVTASSDPTVTLPTVPTILPEPGSEAPTMTTRVWSATRSDGQGFVDALAADAIAFLEGLPGQGDRYPILLPRDWPFGATSATVLVLADIAGQWQSYSVTFEQHQAAPTPQEVVVTIFDGNLLRAGGGPTTSRGSCHAGYLALGEEGLFETTIGPVCGDAHFAGTASPPSDGGGPEVSWFVAGHAFGIEAFPATTPREQVLDLVGTGVVDLQGRSGCELAAHYRGKPGSESITIASGTPYFPEFELSDEGDPSALPMLCQ